VFYYLKHSVSNRPIKLNREIESYIELKFEQTSNDWIANPGSNVQKVTQYGWRLCDINDFKDDTGKENNEYFGTWAGFDLICPEIPKDDGMYMNGDPSSLISSNFNFMINRCN
jgi:hypothetical protein